MVPANPRDPAATAANTDAAAQAVLASAAYLSGDHQGAAGRGLATAAADIGVLNPNAASSITAAVDNSSLSGVKTAYADQQSRVGSINNNQQQTNDQSNLRESGIPPVSPN